MSPFRLKTKRRKPLNFSHLASFVTALLFSAVLWGEPELNDQLTVTGEGQVNYEANFSIFGRAKPSVPVSPGVMLPTIKAEPPSSFTDSDEFFKGVGKESREVEKSRRYR